MAVETINIDLVLRSDYKSTPGAVKVSVNDTLLFHGKLTQPVTKIRETVTLDLLATHTLTIDRYHKPDNDPDQMIVIDYVAIDDINIRDLAWHTSVFYPQYPEPWASEQRELGIELEDSIIGETWLGHNGKWNFEFTSPFYKFLISKVR